MSKGFYEINYESKSYCKIGEEIKVNVLYHQDDEILKPVFISLNQDIAVIDEVGTVKGLKAGVATFQACVIDQENHKRIFEFYVTVLKEEISEEIKFVLDNHNSNCFVRPELGIGAGVPEYYIDIIGSVSKLIYNQKLIKENRYQALQEKNEKNHENEMTKIEFVTVHYTGNMRRTAWGSNNAHYFTTNEQVSIHYVTGTDSGYGYKAFECLPENIGGHHASDLAQGECVWIKTEIKKEANDPEVPVISVEDGYYTINGKKTTYHIPLRDDGIEVLGPTFMFENKVCQTINKMGIAWRISEDGYYELDKTWWGHQIYGKALCNIGGNRNSIGIEACVDKGIDLVMNWQVTAWLVADIITRHHLGFERVMGHHNFSAKNCPQPLLENNLELWKKFMDCVKAEYKLINTFNNIDLSFKPINNFEIVKGVNIHREITGRLLQDENPHCLLGLYKIGNEEIILSTAVNSSLLNKYSEDKVIIQKLGIELD